MMRSLFSAVSGLKTHQTRMDVIGNNVSNVNTVAFKSSSVTFSEIMYQNISNPSGPNVLNGKGGVNAKQIGLGVSMGSTKVSVTSAGAAETTGNPFDIRLTDKSTTNFFIVSTGTENLFTRAGSFYIDGAGNLAMTSTGYTVMGWQVDPTTGEIRKDTVSALRIMQEKNLTSPPEATTNGTASGVLDKNDTNVTSDEGYVMSLNFYDALGYEYNAKFAVKVTNAEEEMYSVELTDILDSNNKSILSDYLNQGGELSAIFGRDTTATKTYPITNQNIHYNNTGAPLDGKIDPGEYYYSYATYDPDGNPITSYALVQLDTINNKYTIDGYDYYTSAEDAIAQTNAVQVEFNDDDKNKVTDLFGITLGQLNSLGSDGDRVGSWDETTGAFVYTEPAVNYELKFSKDDGSFTYVGMQGSDSVTLRLADIFGNKFSDIDIDFSQCVAADNGGKSSMGLDWGTDGGLGAGKALGAMTGLSIDQNGKIWGAYDNGNTELLGQIAVAQFANASGLEKIGENCYKTTLNSGDFDGIGVEVGADGASMISGELEMSNVDLSTEFTQMIITQRGFQSNSRVITTSDTLLEELINLKR